MKNLLFILALFCCPVWLVAQVITTNPVLVTKNAGVITVIFDAAQGNGGLKDYAGPIYAHTGVITNQSTSAADWKHVVTDWPTANNQTAVNTTRNQLVSLGNNKWQLTINPDIYSYYGISDQTEVVTKLAFVFRNADGSKTGKNSDGSDIFVPVYQSALTVKIANPLFNSLLETGSSVLLTANASSNGTLSLYVGDVSALNIASGTPLAQQAATNSLSTSYSFTTPGNYYIIATLSGNGTTVADTSYVCVPKSQVVLNRPSGLKEGITANKDGSVTFCLSLGLSAPVTASTRVYILGDFNHYRLNNNYQMNLQQDVNTYGTGVNFYWLTVSGLEQGKEYTYQYYTDGLTGTPAVRIGDPYCEKILDPQNDQYMNKTALVYPGLRPYPSSLTNGILSCFTVNAPAYHWQYSDNFNAPLQSQLIIYELLLRDFTAEGTVQAAIGKLDYLKDLGINAIEIMPVMEFDGNNSWGYNPNFYFAPDKAYGTKTDYQQLVDECHKRGIAVILDVVLNHTWGLSPYCMVYWDAINNRPAATNPYYNALAPHPYSVGNDINHTYKPVKAWLSRALEFWLTEYKVDGFRFDLSKGFTQTVSNGGAVNPQAALDCSTYDQSRVDNLKTYIDAVKTTNPKAYAILEHFCEDREENALASYDSTMLWRNVSYPFQQAAMGYVSGSGFSPLAAVSQSGGPVVLPTNRVAYAESHDEYRMGYKALKWGITQVKDTTNVFGQLSVCAAFAMLSPGPRMMWQFGELGANYNSKDPNGNNIMDPVPAEWGYLNVPARKSLHDVYAKVLNFRQRYPSLFSQPMAWNWQVSENEWNAGRRIFLTDGTVSAVILGNFTANGGVAVSPSFNKTGIWYELLSGDSLVVTNTSGPLSLPAFGVKIYTNVRITGAASDTTSHETIFLPNPVDDVLSVKGAAVLSCEIMDMAGRVLISVIVANNRINLSGLTAGLYIGKLFFTDGSRKTIKICKR